MYLFPNRTNSKLDIVSLGECMAEFTRAKGDSWRLDFAGDAYNTALYAARLGLRTGFVSCVGDDTLADSMLDAWKKEKIDSSAARVVKNGRTGLYVVSTDSHGERHFDYYRPGSAASLTLAKISAEKIVRQALSSQVFYFTGVTLAVMPEHEKLLEVLNALHGKIAIAFDVNFRAALWSSTKKFRDAMKSVTPFLTHMFMSTEDMSAIGTTVPPLKALQHYDQHGITAVLKCGADGAKYMFNGRLQHALVKKIKPIDTTGAGDAFNAGVLTGLILQKELPDAVALGNSVASIVVQYQGAIVPRGAW